MKYEQPLRATRHCRHYSYEGGPRCAAGVDLSDESFVTGLRACMPDHNGSCALRADYTDEERAASEQNTKDRWERMSNAIAALPRPIPLNTSGAVKCPNCGGELQYARWHRGAEMHCKTEYCCGARFNIATGAEWPI